MKSGNAQATLAPKILAIAVASCFAWEPAFANPTGAQVANGVVSLARPNASTLNVTNSPGAIVNWQGFSIGASEVTRFIQQSAASAVLNRVVGGNISQIQGQLLSNGKVFLINPSGIVVGPGAVIDTAGFVGSTLNMLDADFLAGKLKFQGDANSGSIINQGWIKTASGGQVILVAPQIENSGLIHTPGGEIILAAGKSLTIASLDHEGVQFEIQAPTDAVVNVGKLLAEGGAIGVFAGTLKHSGDTRATSLSADATGQIVLTASGGIELAAGSVTSASGVTGGKVQIQSGETTLVSGTVEATGAALPLPPGEGGGEGGGSAGHGGIIHILGNKVGLIEGAKVDASGTNGGGMVLVGGDFQGQNLDVKSALRTYVGLDATLNADAISTGDGGKVIVWADDATRAYGAISARGGAQSGNGGLVEVSGKRWLDFNASVDVRAPYGATGSLLLDPNAITITATTDSFGSGNFTGGNPDVFESPGSDGSSQIAWTTIKSNLSTADVYVTTTGDSTGGATAITVSADSPDLATSRTLRLISNQDVVVNGKITNTGTGSLEMYAGWDGISTATPVVNQTGAITINSAISVAGDVSLIATNNIAQAITASITANRLLASSNSGTVTLNLATNMVNTLAGSASGGFQFTNGKSLTVDTVGGVSGITVPGNFDATIDVTVTSGNLTVSGNVTSTGANDADGGGTAAISLTTQNGAIAIGAGTSIVADAGNGPGAPTATVTLSATSGGITSGAGGAISAVAGNKSSGAGAAGMVTLTSTNAITLNTTTVAGTGGDTGDTMGGAGGAADVLIRAGGAIDLTGSAVSATGGTAFTGPSGVGTATVEVSAASGNATPSGDITVHNITADDVNLQQQSDAGNRSILRASASSLIQAGDLLMEIDYPGSTSGGSIGTSTEPMRVQVARLEAHTHEASPGIFIESPNAGNLQIGGVSFFGGSVKGVQNVTSGDISLSVNGTLTLQGGTAGCGATGGTGGPVCTGGSTVTLIANDMALNNVVNANTGTVALAPFSTTRNIAIFDPLSFAPVALALTPLELSQITAGTIEIGRSSDLGTLSVTTPLTNADFTAGVGTLKLAHGFLNINGAIGTSGARFDRNLTLTSDGQISINAFGPIHLNNKTLSATAPIIEINAAADVGAGTIQLTSTGTTEQTAPITAGTLELLGAGGDHALTDPGNQIGTVKADTGSVTLVNDGALVVSGIAAGGVGTETIVTASPPVAGEGFGGSIAVKGDLMIVGAPGAFMTGIGAVYVYRWNGSAWVFEAKLVPPDSIARNFGTGVAVEGTHAVVGAPETTDGGVFRSGAAYAFEFNGSNWGGGTKLSFSQKVFESVFGVSAAIDNNRLVVGGNGRTSEGGFWTGKIWFYDFVSGAWVERGNARQSDPQANDYFGLNLAISGDRMIVGAHNGPSSNASLPGKAYIFEFNPATRVWFQTQKLTGAAASDFFGRDVSISGDVAVVGAFQADPGGVTSGGAAHVYRFNGVSWVQEQVLVPDDVAASDFFGHRVAVRGDTIVASSYGQDPGGVNDAGAAYVFKHNGSQWVQEQKITASNAAAIDRLGFGAVALPADGRLYISTPFADPGGVLTAGALYVYAPLANSTLTGALTITAAGALTQEAAVSAGGAVSYTSASNIAINAALNAGANPITFNAPGTVAQTAPITASGLELLGSGGSYTLTNASNAVGTLAANTGSVSFTNSGALATGTVGGTTGVSTTGNVILGTVSGDLTIAADINAGTGVIDATGVSGTAQFSGTRTIASTNAGTGFSAGTITVDGTDNVSLNATSSAGTLNFTGGTLTGSGDLSISSGFNWSGGAISGTGSNTLTTNGASNLSGGTKTLSSRIWNNAATATWTGGSINLSNAGAVVNNQGTFTANLASFSDDFLGVGTFNNLNGAVFNSNAGGFDVSFNGPSATNAGQINVSNGRFNFVQDFTNTGTINLTGPGAVFEAFTGSTANLNAGTSIIGTGEVRVANGTLNINTPLTLPNTQTLSLQGGTLNVNAATAADAMSVTSGTLTGAGDLTISSSFNQTGGTQTGTGSTILGPAVTSSLGAIALDRKLTVQGTLNLSGTSTSALITNAGTISVTGATTASGGIQQTSGAIDVAGGSTLSLGGTGLQLQGGVLSGTGTIAGNVDNSAGTLAPGASTGILTISGDYTQGASGALSIEIAGTTPGTQHDQLAVTGTATLGGTLDVIELSGATLAAGNSFTVLTCATCSGIFGTVTATGLSLTTNYLAAGVNLSLDALLNGWNAGGSGAWETPANWSRGVVPTADHTVTIDVPGTTETITIGGGAQSVLSITTNENLTLSGGSLDVASTSTVNAAFTLSGGTLQGVGTLTVNGNLNWSGGTMSGGGTTVATNGVSFSGATTHALSTRTLTLNAPTTLGAGEILGINTGVIDGTGALTNQGTLNVTSGTLTTLINQGTANLNANAVISGVFSNSGTVNVNGVAGALGGMQQTAGTLNLAGGSLLAMGGTGLDLQGGTLSGTGTITGDVNNVAGTVAPGASPGILTIAGNYTQGPSGTLNMEIGGTTPGTQYDQLAVSGNASLDGTLNAVTIGGFLPLAGDTFNFIQAGGTLGGTFATTNLPAGSTFSENYLPSSFDVTTVTSNAGGLASTALADLSVEVIVTEKQTLDKVATDLGPAAPTEDAPPEPVPMCR